MVHKKFARRQIILAAGISLAVICVLSFYLWHITENVRLGYAVSDARSRIRALQEDVNRLKTRKASLLSLERVEKTARKELGLTDPREDQIIYEEFR
jgi:cell division protein FtsL